MPIDASIISSLRPPAPIELQDPIASYAKGLQLKSLMGAQQLQGVQLQQAQEGLADSQAARDAYKLSINPDTGLVDQGVLLKNLAGRGAVGPYQTAQKSFLDADKARADISKAKAEVLTHKITAYKSLLESANNPQDLGALYAAQYKDPDLGPILQGRGSLEDQLKNIPQDPVAFKEFKIKAEKGMSGFQELLQKQQTQAETARGHDLTYGASMYGHQVAERGQQMHADTEARKLDPFGLNANTPAIGALGTIAPPAAPAAPAGGLPPTPGGMPVNPSGGFRGDRNAPELPAMRAAMAAPLAPTGVDQSDLLAAQMGLRNAKTPAARLGFQQAIESIQKDMAAQGVTPAPESAAAVAPAAPSGTRPAIDMSLTGDDFLKQIKDRNPGLANQVKAVAEGREPFPSSMGLRTPQGQQFMAMVTQYDPQFDAVNYQARNKTYSSFSAGPDSEKVRFANQTLHHAGQVADAIDKLDNFNGIRTPLNAPVNAIQRAFGDSRQGVFEEKTRAMASELRKFFASVGGGGLQELNKWESSMPLNASQQQQKDYLKAGMELLQGGLSSLQEKYKAGMGGQADVKQLLKPEAQQVLNRLTGVESASVIPKVFDSLPDPSQYNGKTAIGDDGTKYVSDGKSWRRK